MKRFAMLGLRKHHFVFSRKVFFGGKLTDLDTIPIAIDFSDSEKVRTIVIGEILMTPIPYDSLLRTEWLMLVNEIKEARNRVYLSAYREFQKIVEYVQKTP